MALQSRIAQVSSNGTTTTVFEYTGKGILQKIELENTVSTGSGLSYGYYSAHISIDGEPEVSIRRILSNTFDSNQPQLEIIDLNLVFTSRITVRFSATYAGRIVVFYSGEV